MDHFKYLRQRLSTIKQDPDDRELVFFIMRDRVGYYWLIQQVNESERPDRFKVTHHRYRAWQTSERHDMQYMGVLHTHPDPERPNPSPDDYCLASKSRILLYAVYCPTLRRLTWHNNENELWRVTIPMKTRARHK